jgi:hypothetical protein
MNIEDIRAELESDFRWRQGELLFLQNQGASLAEAEQETFRRAVVVLLYAHFEGFCKFALLVYVNEVNKAQVKCHEASYALAAASLADLFEALRNPMKKCEIFHNTLPDETKLHRFARDREFVERSNEFLGRTVAVPEKVVDTESNLKPIVLQKNLFRLGLPHDLFSLYEGTIHRLLETRNKIAHGISKEGLKRENYEELRNAVFIVMEQIVAEITTALREKKYLRAVTLPEIVSAN